MVTLTRKLVEEKQDRLLFCGIIIIAANAGGAWSPIGDVTTTMLWIGGQVSAGPLIINLILPSLVCLLLPLCIVSLTVKGDVTRPVAENPSSHSNREQTIVFFSGVIILLLVPVFKTVTHLPPYMGILIGLGILWIITELMHKKREEEEKIRSVSAALRRIDTPSILFFLGILLSIAAFESSGLLGSFAEWLSARTTNESTIAISSGLVSAIIDNVPLVAATQGMYGPDQYPTDHSFWHFMAYTTGTGGSVLVIGSAAGIAAMGIEKISFFWYVKRISLLALAGYLAGAMVYILIQGLS
jgi:Na+/H+ antiporter NhaD/arsenite permease-like protein